MQTFTTLRRIALLALIVFAAACNRGGDTMAKPTIALVVKTLNNQFFIDMEAGAKAAADSLGFDLVVQAPEREIDVERQMQIVENLIQHRVAVIMLVPNGSKEIVPSVVKANAAKIPVITVDTRVDASTLTAAGATVVTFIGSDNEDGGRMAGASSSKGWVVLRASPCWKVCRAMRRPTRASEDFARHSPR